MKKREIWLDILRVIAAFLVIVNHTNSDLFMATTPQQGTWWLSITWYALCKIAVPLFVMVSGAVLLGRQDSFGKCLARFGRTVGALVAFTYLYYLHYAWVNTGLWPQMIQFNKVFHEIWTQQNAGSFWYLYFYAGLMLALPLLQRLSCAMSDRDAAYLILLSVILDAGWPLLAHFVPAFALPVSFDVPGFTVMIGLFFAGWQLRKRAKPMYTMPWLIGLIASVLISVLLLHTEYTALNGSGKYWAFMDDRAKPSLFVIAGSISTFQLIRCLYDRPMSQRTQRIWLELGGCTFAIYLLQQWVIAQTEYRLFLPLCNSLPAFVALLVWEIVVFLLCLLAAMVLKRIPLLKKIL